MGSDSDSDEMGGGVVFIYGVSQELKGCKFIPCESDPWTNLVIICLSVCKIWCRLL